MTERSQDRWDVWPDAGSAYCSSEHVFLSSDLVKLIAKAAKKQRKRGPIGFVPNPRPAPDACGECGK